MMDGDGAAPGESNGDDGITEESVVRMGASMNAWAGHGGLPAAQHEGGGNVVWDTSKQRRSDDFNSLSDVCRRFGVGDG